MYFIKENGDSIINQAKSAGAAGADIIKSLFNFIGLICSSSCNMVRSIYNIFNIIGFKNIFSTIGAGHMTKKVYDFGKGACDKVKNWFKSRPQKQEKKKEVKKINLKGWLKNNKEKIEVNIE